VHVESLCNFKAFVICEYLNLVSHEHFGDQCCTFNVCIFAVKHGLPQRSLFCPLHFLVSITISHLFSVRNTNQHPENDFFQNCISDAFASLNKWVKTNKHGLYLDKMKCMKFSANIKTYVNLNISYGNKIIKVPISKFLGLQILSNLNWDIKHIWDMLPIVVSCDYYGPEPSYLQ